MSTSVRACTGEVGTSTQSNITTALAPAATRSSNDRTTVHVVTWNPNDLRDDTGRTVRALAAEEARYSPGAFFSRTVRRKRENNTRLV